MALRSGRHRVGPYSKVSAKVPYTQHLPLPIEPNHRVQDKDVCGLCAATDCGEWGRPLHLLSGAISSNLLLKCRGSESQNIQF